MTQKNIKAKFAACGIHPFKPSAIPEEAFAPNDVTQREYTEENPMTSNVVSNKNTAELSATLASPTSVSKFHLFSTRKKNSPKKRNNRKGINSMPVRLNQDSFPDNNTGSSNDSDCSFS